MWFYMAIFGLILSATCLIVKRLICWIVSIILFWSYKYSASETDFIIITRLKYPIRQTDSAQCICQFKNKPSDWCFIMFERVIHVRLWWFIYLLVRLFKVYLTLLSVTQSNSLMMRWYRRVIGKIMEGNGNGPI
jgi:hypothetical protein